ncbi:MAG: hypothetical protein AB1925_02645 [Actinomycetota bacterium]
MAAVIVTLMMAATGLFGYYLGRRSPARSLSWRQRTTRPALARQAITLLALVALSQVQRSAGRRRPRRS